MYVLTGDLDEAALEVATGRVATTITSRGGEITGTDPWGRRRLAYPIQHHLDGYYSVLRLKLKPESIVPIERDLRLNESVVRHLLIRPGN
jgi:small subunit ribosomal protein S6